MWLFGCDNEVWEENAIFRWKLRKLGWTNHEDVNIGYLILQNNS